MKLVLFFLICLSQVAIFGTFDDPPTFGPRMDLGEIENDKIVEASGIVASQKNHGILWTHHDGGHESIIFAIDTNGVSRGEYYLENIANRDWEDIAIGPGPDTGETYIYVGEIGDNESIYPEKYIYRFIEPNVSLMQSNVKDTIQNISTIAFTYPDGERDAETLLLDPLTRDLFVVSKRDSKVRLYELKYPQSTSDTIEANLSAELSFPNDPEATPFNRLSGGDISNDGTEIIIKSYQDIYYWKRSEEESISQTLIEQPDTLTYITEHLGEAICWKNYADNGYYTLSEEYRGTIYESANLYYYPRTSVVSSVDDFIINTNFELNQNYPNPFNPNTKISYTITNIEPRQYLPVQLKVYDNLGKEVSTLVNEKQNQGSYEVNFNADNLSSGIYYYSLRYGNYLKINKMVLLK